MAKHTHRNKRNNIKKRIFLNKRNTLKKRITIKKKNTLKRKNKSKRKTQRGGWKEGSMRRLGPFRLTRDSGFKKLKKNIENGHTFYIHGPVENQNPNGYYTNCGIKTNNRQHDIINRGICITKMVRDSYNHQYRFLATKKALTKGLFRGSDKQRMMQFVYTHDDDSNNNEGPRGYNCFLITYENNSHQSTLTPYNIHDVLQVSFVDDITSTDSAPSAAEANAAESVDDRTPIPLIPCKYDDTENGSTQQIDKSILWIINYLTKEDKKSAQWQGMNAGHAYDKKSIAIKLIDDSWLELTTDYNERMQRWTNEWNIGEEMGATHVKQKMRDVEAHFWGNPKGGQESQLGAKLHAPQHPNEWGGQPRNHNNTKRTLPSKFLHKKTILHKINPVLIPNDPRAGEDRIPYEENDDYYFNEAFKKWEAPRYFFGVITNLVPKHSVKITNPMIQLLDEIINFNMWESVNITYNTNNLEISAKVGNLSYEQFGNSAKVGNLSANASRIIQFNENDM